MKLIAGTSKGLITFSINHGKLEISSLEFEGFDVSSVHQHYDGGIYAAISHKHWGVKLFHKSVGESTWNQLRLPEFNKGHTDVKGRQAVLKQIWNIHHGGRDFPNRLWLGTEPGALFLSEDKGQSWKLIEGLWNHETRTINRQWFGAGKDLPFVHSIIVHPKNNNIVYISVSCAGVFRTSDSGKSWELMNKGMKATYLPTSTPVAGYDPHLMLMSQKDNNVLWQQNHCGIYRSRDGGLEWKDVGGPDGFPGYGFCIAIEEKETGTAWVIPVEDETKRVPQNHKLMVMKTIDGGKSWQNSSKGLPEGYFFGIVLRNGFSKKDGNLAFGTTNGNVYYSEDYGKTWMEGATNLTKVNYISFINEEII